MKGNNKERQKKKNKGWRAFTEYLCPGTGLSHNLYVSYVSLDSQCRCGDMLTNTFFKSVFISDTFR